MFMYWKSNPPPNHTSNHSALLSSKNASSLVGRIAEYSSLRILRSTKLSTVTGSLMYNL